jgi:chromosome partitioning protein
MPSIIAFVSQGGNVAKTTLAAAIALRLAEAGNQVSGVDLDLEHFLLGASLKRWLDKRAKQQPHRVQIESYYYPSVEAALIWTNRRPAGEIVIIDCPSRASQATVEVATKADFTIVPIVPGPKDTPLMLRSLEKLIAAGVPPERLAIMLTRTGSEAEERSFRLTLSTTRIGGHLLRVIDKALPEQIGYRTALARGQAVTEATPNSIGRAAREAVDALIDAYLTVTDPAPTPTSSLTP